MSLRGTLSNSSKDSNNNVSDYNFLVLPKGDELTISSGAITVTHSYHEIDTESNAATDDLDTINGGAYDGAILLLRTANSTRDVTIKDGTGNIQGPGDTDLNNSRDQVMLRYDSQLSEWRIVAIGNLA